MVCMTPGVYTKVLEAAECCGDTKSPVPFQDTGKVFHHSLLKLLVQMVVFH